MVPSLSFKPDRITKMPSASPINPPQSSELLRRNLTLLFSLTGQFVFLASPSVSITLRSESVTSTTNFL